MGSPQLENLVRIRQLKEEAPARAEIDGLIRSGNVRLKDAQLHNLSVDSRFELAYNTAHAFSLAALRWRALLAAVNPPGSAHRRSTGLFLRAE
jgi:hypothetical protein